MLWLEPTPRRLAVRALRDVRAALGIGVLAAAVAVARCGWWSRHVRPPGARLSAAGVRALRRVPPVVPGNDHRPVLAPASCPWSWLAARGLQFCRTVRDPGRSPSRGRVSIVSVPVGMAYGREAHPAFRAIAAAASGAHRDACRDVYALQSLARAPGRSVAVGGRAAAAVRVAGAGRRTGEKAASLPSGFLPIRGDRSRADRSAARQDVIRFPWAVADRPELGGIAPLGADWYRIPPWLVCRRRWSLTPETGGLAQARRRSRSRPIEAWFGDGRGPFTWSSAAGILASRAILRPTSSWRSTAGRDRWTLTRRTAQLLAVHRLPGRLFLGPAYARLTIASRAGR